MWDSMLSAGFTAQWWSPQEWAGAHALGMGAVAPQDACQSATALST